MKTRLLLLILLCSLPAFADKNRREAEKVVTGIQDSLKRVGSVNQASAGHRDDMSCSVSWTENVLVTDNLGCKVAISEAGSNVQICTKDGTSDKSIVSNEWDNKVSFDLTKLKSSTVALKEKKNETLNDFPNTSTGKIYELSFSSKRQERVISWSSKLKYISRNAKSLVGPGDVTTDHQEGVWDQFALQEASRARDSSRAADFAVRASCISRIRRPKRTRARNSSASNGCEAVQLRHRESHENQIKMVSGEFCQRLLAIDGADHRHAHLFQREGH
jgi:hypothetical protein